LDLLNLALGVQYPGSKAMVLQTCPGPQAGSGISQTAKAPSLLLEVCIIGLETRVAGHTHRVAVTVASLALVTATPSQARAAEATARDFVTASTFCSPEVTVTGSASHGHISVRTIRTLADSSSTARQATKPFSTGTLPCELVALGTEGVVRVTGTWFTASAAGQLPVEGSTLVTFGAHYIGQTQAAPTLLITGHIPPGPQDTAVTAVAALWVGISKSSEAGLAQVTALSLYILLAHTLAGHWVTGSPWNCPIWVTLARDTGLLNGSSWSSVLEIVQLTSLTVLAFSVVPAVVTYTSICPLAGSKHSWVEVTGLRVPIAITPLAFMGVLALGGSPGPVVVERCTALTVGAGSVVLAGADIMDLHSSGGSCRVSRLGGTAVSMAMTEAAPLQTQLGHSKVGTGWVVAPLG
jgi:hypothetical protein